MRINNGILHAMQIAGGNKELSELLGIKKARLSFIIHRLEGYCPRTLKNKIQEKLNVADEEFNYYSDANENLKYITKSWIERTLLMKYKNKKIGGQQNA